MKHEFFYVVEVSSTEKDIPVRFFNFSYLHDAVALCKALDTCSDKTFYKIMNMAK